jgi:hypothetical protein
MREKRHPSAAMVSLPPPPPLPNREVLLQPPPHRNRPSPINNAPTTTYFNREDRGSRHSNRQFPGAISPWRFAGNLGDLLLLCLHFVFMLTRALSV